MICKVNQNFAEQSGRPIDKTANVAVSHLIVGNPIGSLTFICVRILNITD